MIMIIYTKLKKLIAAVTSYRLCNMMHLTIITRATINVYLKVNRAAARERAVIFRNPKICFTYDIHYRIERVMLIFYT